MPWLVIAAVVVAGLAYASSRGIAPAQGRSWRIVRASAPPKWLATMIDAAPRLAADKQWIVVRIETTRREDGAANGPIRQPALVIADRQIGERAIAGHFHTTDDIPLPPVWGPALGAPVELALEDIYYLAN